MAKQEKRPGESIDSVLRKFKRKLKNEGTIEKPSDSKKRKIKAAVRRTRQQQQADKI